MRFLVLENGLSTQLRSSDGSAPRLRAIDRNGQRINVVAISTANESGESTAKNKARCFAAASFSRSTFKSLMTLGDKTFHRSAKCSRAHNETSLSRRT